MRPLELTLALCLVLSSIAFANAQWRPVAVASCILAACVLPVHLSIDGARLQALPLYLSVPALLLLMFLNPISQPMLRVSVSFFGIALAVSGGVACYTYPVFSLPLPDGPYVIGTAPFYLIDRSRNEVLAPQGGYRRIIAQIWYPAAQSVGTLANYRDPASLTWKSHHLRYVKTHAYVNAPILKKSRWPVVFFSPSSGGFRSQNTFMVEHLVSHGYIVVALDHPDTSSRAVFPDGITIQSLPDVWLDLESREAFARSWAKTEQILETNVRDIQFVLDTLETSPANTQAQLVARQARMLESLATEMDFGRVGAVGHSFGGAAAAEICRIDKRVRAGVNLDGFTFSGVNRDGVQVPFLTLSPGQGDSFWITDAGPFPDTPEGIRRQLDSISSKAIQHSVNRWGNCAANLIGVQHESFADIALFRNSIRHSANAPSVTVAHTVINSLVHSFLDENLKGFRGVFQQSVERNSTYVKAECGSLPERAENTAGHVR